VLRSAILAGNHHENHFIGVSIGDIAYAYYLSRFHYGHSVCDLENIAHNVRDIDNAITALFKTPNKIEDLPGLRDPERRGWFIHDNYVRVEADTFGNRN
jgi:hypothetical protein